MILESLITNESALTLDCAKATLRRGGRVTIPDEHWANPEVQNALRMNLVKLVGDPPACAARTEEKRLRLKNNHTTRLAIECVKASVGPGEILNLPESKLHEREIQNAIAWGQLVDLSAPVVAPAAKAPPVEIDEVKVPAEQPKGEAKAETKTETEDALDLILGQTMQPAERKPEPPAAPKPPVPASRPRPTPKPNAVKAKKVTSKHEDDPAGGEDEDALFRPSVIHEKPTAAKRPREMPEEDPVETEESREEKKDRWLDIFDELDAKPSEKDKKSDKKADGEDDFLK